MGTLFKVVLLATPALALVVYLTLQWQGSVKTDLRKDDATFDRAWAEFDLPRDPARSRERAAKADQELAKIEQEKEQEEARRKREMEEIRGVLDDKPLPPERVSERVKSLREEAEEARRKGQEEEARSKAAVEEVRRQAYGPGPGEREAGK